MKKPKVNVKKLIHFLRYCLKQMFCFSNKSIRKHFPEKKLTTIFAGFRVALT